MTAD